MNRIIRVIIADDDLVMRKELCALLENVAEVEVVAETTNGVEVVRKAKIFAPDVVLLDLDMPDQTAIETIQEIQHTSPHTRILVLTCYGEDDKVIAAIKAGAHGSVRKATTSSWLLQTIRSLCSVHPTLDATTARKLIRELNRPTVLPPADEPLTEREAQVLILIARGLTISIIADRFFMSEQTVYAHINSILNKYHPFFGRTPDED